MSSLAESFARRDYRDRIEKALRALEAEVVGECATPTQQLVKYALHFAAAHASDSPSRPYFVQDATQDLLEAVREYVDESTPLDASRSTT